MNFTGLQTRDEGGRRGNILKWRVMIRLLRLTGSQSQVVFKPRMAAVLVLKVY